MTTLAEALAPKSDQLNAADLISGPRTIKITAARINKEDRAIKIILNFEGDNGKPWKPCKTMGRGMVMAWSITEPEQFVGKSVRVYRDPAVSFGAETEIGGIRISHLSHIEKTVHAKLMVSKGKYQTFTFAPLPTEVAKDTAPEFTLEQARYDITNADTLDALKAAWSRKIMQPYRDALQGDLDTRKTALTPAVDGAHTQALTEALAEIEKATDPDRINKAVQLTLPALSEDEGQVLRDAATGRIADLAGEGAK